MKSPCAVTGICRINDNLVEYTCECGAKTDSSSDLNGWAFTKDLAYCPKCDRANTKRQGAGGVPSDTPKAAPSASLSSEDERTHAATPRTGDES